MNKLASAAVAATLAGVMAIPAPAAAQSVNIQFGQQDRFVGRYCNERPGLRGCNDWRQNRNRWDRDDYRRWYGWNRGNFGSSVAAGIFGFAAGAAIANGINNSNNDRGYDSHVARCEARYRSYDAETDMFKGYDGQWHRCRL